MVFMPITLNDLQLGSVGDTEFSKISQPWRMGPALPRDQVFGLLV